MLSINTNLSSLIAQNSMNTSTNKLNQAIERMTTGSKINHAKDNAANYSIINDLNTRISSMLQVQQNTEDGISLLSIAEGGLNEIQGLLERLRELTVQASNDTYDSKTRAAMQAEADAIVEEINRLKSNIEYDGMNLYETQSRVLSNTPAARLAQAVRVSMTTDAGESISNDTFALNPVSLTNEADDLSLSSVSSDLVNSVNPSQPSPSREGVGVNNGVNNTPSNENIPMARTMMRSASPASTTIDGAVNFASGETKTITIDGVIYEVTNLNNTTNSLSYSKDTSTGQITFLCNKFKIVGQSNVSHNIVIDGKNNEIYGGEVADIITGKDSKAYDNYFYGEGGDDTLTVTTDGSARRYYYIYGGSGNDTISTIGNGIAYLYTNGDDGDDIFNIAVDGAAGTVHGGADNDTFNIAYMVTHKIYGDDGDDIFNIESGRDSIVDGGTGLNKVLTNNGTNIKRINVENPNAAEIEFNNETKVLNINGIDYTITGRGSLIYSIADDGTIDFSAPSFIIKGDENAVHKIILSGNNTSFYGGNCADTITIKSHSNNVYVGSGDNKVYVNGYSNQVHTGEGNDYIEVANVYNRIFSGAGDDEIKISGRLNTIYTDSGDDIVTVSSNQNAIAGGSGNNTIINNSSDNMFADFGLNDNAEYVMVSANSIQTVNIAGKEYSVQNSNPSNAYILYNYDETTGKLTLHATGRNLTISAVDTNQAQNVLLKGASYAFNGSNVDDTIEIDGNAISAYGLGGDDELSLIGGGLNKIYGDAGNDKLYSNSGNVFGGAGDDILILDSADQVNGGDGNDIYYINSNLINPSDDGGNNEYYINTNNANITGSADNDTFYITGSNNTVKGGGGDDYFTIDGDNNTLDGGTGNNYFVDNGTGNVPSNIIIDPNSATINFSYVNEVVTRIINGKTYTFTNKGSAANSLSYNLNTNTNTILMSGSGVQIDCVDNVTNILAIRGDNNIVNGGNLADKITIEQGTNNTINGNAGDDTIINDSENNAIYGGAGNDAITLNKTTNLEVNGGADNDTINVASSNNTEVFAGTGNDKITISGTNNTIEAQGGNNTINITGASNIVNVDEGDNKVVIGSNNNEVTLGDGNNSFGISGSNNTVSSLHTVGNLNINGNENTVILGNVMTYAAGPSNAFDGNITVQGNDNIILQESGDNNVSIKGSGNEYSSTTGKKDITANGNGNSISTSEGNDKISVKGDSNNITTTSGNNTITITGNSNQIQGGAGVDTIKLSGNMNTAMGGDGNDAFSLTSGSNNTIDGEGGDKNTFVNYSNDITYSNVIDVTPQGFQLNLKIGIGYDENSVISTNIEFNPIFLNVDLSSRESSLASLETIDETLKSVNEQLLKIGSVINRLEMVLDEQNIKLENMLSTRSTLRDADIAELSSAYIQQQILQQASATLLATANQSPNVALALI